MDEIEIPEAIRENIELPKKSRLTLSLPLIIGIIFCLGVAGLFSMFVLSPKPKSAPQTVKQPATQPRSPQQETAPQNPQTVSPPQEKTPTKPSKGDLLGHLPYQVAPQESLAPITADNRLKMRSAAASKFKQMQTDARAQGVILVPISAFRTAEAQEQLFFGVKEQRVQDATKRAEVSAPPGYSEHHTGYAIDLGDGNAPATNLETDFANTAAFSWLKENALKYSFELSFPPDNDLGVSYEPWHWRFVGDRDSLETFYKARN
ncbi:D-alanyl-D-alanine carboxypeptidase family protein [Waterburya agarophytonicola K14]|uniref:D-alanyl-D-alanine carboxypeptidase family protein n=1 Tax=Waterburya agarophytonicola KI4 TaxID=2874699 RepID=A0A964BMI7_9CYAN|nr:M15 family metallopeptidase [Waterburya agarophytonicola]MCC0176224.1 D-alanyl-D-alanine carboxypeptidase family protein [Waterburya agarophytonicola KI4]